MSYKVLTIAPFEKQVKYLTKKYPSIKSDLSELVSELINDPQKGAALGNDCYKIRMAISSKGRGKSGGARVITYFALNNGEIYLLSIYDKSEQSDINNKELLKLLDLAK